MPLEINVNGEARAVQGDPMTPLLTVLREEMHLTGAKLSCGEGFCGACTVLLDGTPAMSCLMPVGLVGERAVLTIEGLAPAGSELVPVQKAMLDNDAVQCGMCFPGMVLTLSALLQQNDSPSEDMIREALVGNICRCTGYERIVAAALEASRATVADAQEVSR